MTGSTRLKQTQSGILLALLAVVIWSGNFIVAKSVTGQIPPIALNFFRWFVAAVIIAPFAIRYFKNEIPVIRKSGAFLFWISLTGVSLFNTFVYIGAYH